MKKSWFMLVCLMMTHTTLSATADDSTVKIASKLHTEGVILAELMTHLVNHAGAQAIHKRELGGTHVIWKALKRGEIDLYAEYTGTIMKELFPNDGLKTVDDIRQKLLTENMQISQPLGFNSTYAISMKKEVAAHYGMTKISDLRHYPD